MVLTINVPVVALLQPLVPVVAGIPPVAGDSVMALLVLEKVRLLPVVFVNDTTAEVLPVYTAVTLEFAFPYEKHVFVQVPVTPVGQFALLFVIAAYIAWAALSAVLPYHTHGSVA